MDHPTNPDAAQATSSAPTAVGNSPVEIPEYPPHNPFKGGHSRRRTTTRLASQKPKHVAGFYSSNRTYQRASVSHNVAIASSRMRAVTPPPRTRKRRARTEEGARTRVRSVPPLEGASGPALEKGNSDDNGGGVLVSWGISAEALTVLGGQVIGDGGEAAEPEATGKGKGKGNGNGKEKGKGKGKGKAKVSKYRLRYDPKIQPLTTNSHPYFSSPKFTNHFLSVK